MKIITIMGSPKKNGKTASALKLFEENMSTGGHEVERLNITDYKINGCLGCFACFSKPEEPGCVQKDDAQIIFEKILAADAVVYASPLYSFDLTAQLKPLVDRHFCFMNKSLLKGKRMALLVTCAGPVEDNADLVQIFFNRAFDSAHGGKFPTILTGSYVVPFSDTPDFLQRAQRTADQMSAEITSKL